MGIRISGFYFWLHWVFVAAHGLSLVAASRGYSSFQHFGFSLRWLLLWRSTGSRHGASVVVARGLSSCGSRALALRLSSVVHGLSCSAACGIFPDQGSNPMFPALSGGFLTTAPPGKSLMKIC